MGIGPFTTYMPPSVWGPTPREWSFGSGPLPDWAEVFVRDACMANIGLKPIRKLRRWIFRYFERRREEEDRRDRGRGYRGTTNWALHTRVLVENEIVEVIWSPFETRAISIPRKALVPSTLTLIAIHDC